MWFLVFITSSCRGGVHPPHVTHSSVCIELPELRAPWYILHCVPAVQEHLAAQPRPWFDQTVRLEWTYAITGITKLGSREEALKWQEPENDKEVERAYQRQAMIASHKARIEQLTVPAQRKEAEAQSACLLKRFDTGDTFKYVKK